MKRRDILKKTGAGLTMTSGLASVAAAGDVETSSCSGDCFYEECYCDGEWYDCGLEPGGCCDGEIICECKPTCDPGCPC